MKKNNFNNNRIPYDALSLNDVENLTPRGLQGIADAYMEAGSTFEEYYSENARFAASNGKPVPSRAAFLAAWLNAKTARGD